ncbi:MAG TPA: hypothetical protein VGC74_02430 [Stenotrophomonas sp.]|jgi:hypothetical protein
MQPRLAHYRSDKHEPPRVTDASIKSDVEAFQAAGGVIEKLGHSPLRRTHPEAAAAVAEPVAHAKV